MGSGYFPLQSDDESGQKLAEAARLVQEVIELFRESISSGEDGQFDNAASDGASLALLGLTARLIREEVRD